MNRQKLFSRRIFLKTLMGGLLMMLTETSKIPLLFANYAKDDDLYRFLLNFFNQIDSAITVGSAYLEQHPDESNVNQLIHDIFQMDRKRLVQLAQKKPSRLTAIIEKQVREDFDSQNMVKIKGWLLSRTETRLCALVYLINKDI